MNGDSISKIQLLEHIKTKYANCFEMYDSIKQKSKKVLISKAYSASLYVKKIMLDGLMRMLLMVFALCSIETMSRQMSMLMSTHMMI